jgi:hypothetical protein
MTTTVTIGRNVADGAPLNDETWASFRDSLFGIVDEHCEAVYFFGEGTGWSPQWGFETAYTIIAEDAPSREVHADMERVLALLGVSYRQEAVAVSSEYTAGKVVFV